ncbi:hypothetical protein FOCC_FOCC012081 [Frankliniella occidentalis]|nr:hypothetical protein FOCC_FOCC012081 [Frankliniella occidentalis]
MRLHYLSPATAFEALVRDFEKRGQQLLFLDVDPEVRDLLHRAGLYNSISFCEEEDDLPAMLFGESLLRSGQDGDDDEQSEERTEPAASALIPLNVWEEAPTGGDRPQLTQRAASVPS